MAEHDTSWHLTRGPKLDGFSCREKLYILFSLFQSSKGISNLCDDEIGCPFRQMLDEHEERLITQLMIETAVLMRMKDDLFEQQHGMKSECDKDIVGRLFIPKDSAAPQALNLREACNKLIHANLINFNFENIDNWNGRHLLPEIYLYGNFRGTEWKAELNITDWVRFGATMFP